MSYHLPANFLMVWASQATNTDTAIAPTNTNCSSSFRSPCLRRPCRLDFTRAVYGGLLSARELPTALFGRYEFRAVEGAYCCREYHCRQECLTSLWKEPAKHVTGPRRQRGRCARCSGNSAIRPEATRQPRGVPASADSLPTPRPATFSGRHSSAYSHTSTAASRTA